MPIPPAGLPAQTAQNVRPAHLVVGPIWIFNVLGNRTASKSESRNRAVSQPTSEAIRLLGEGGGGDAGRGAGRQPEPIHCKVGTTPQLEK